MANKAKPSTKRGTVSPEDRLKALREFPGLSDEQTFVNNLIKSLNAHRPEDTSSGTINRPCAEKLQQLLKNFSNKFSKQICRQMIGDELAEANAVPILMKYMNILTDNGSDYPLDGYNLQCYKIIRSVVWNFTDASPNLCKQVGKKGMLIMLLRELEYFKKTFKSNDAKRFIVRSAMGIFNNCSNVSENIKYFREMNAVPTVAWYAKNTGQELEDDLTTSSMMTLSYIVDEDNDDIISADDFILQTFLQLLEGALKSSNRLYRSYSSIEVVRALTRLANNDKNSETIVQKGILKSLLKMMKGDEEDRLVATEAVWALTFVDVNKKKIEAFQNGSVMEYLRKFSKSQSIDLQTAANGALWVLELVTKSQAKQEQSQACKEICEGHIMLSYQWDSQDTIKKVRNLLLSEGYKVWMDIDNMSGSILDGMADAVEKASVVLVCLSQKYKESRSCRAEGEYAYSMNKPVIPVLVEDEYKADGWLGVLVGMKLYFDLSNDKKLEANISKLVKEISVYK